MTRLRTFTRTIFPAPWFPFWRGMEKNKQKPAVTFDLLYSKIRNFNLVCVLIFLSLGRNFLL